MGLPCPLSGPDALRRQHQQEPAVLAEAFAPHLNAERVAGAAQGDLRDPESGSFAEREGPEEGCFPGPLRPLREDPDRFVPWAVIKGFFGRFMGRSEREHARVVDQNIDMAVAKFDRPSRHFAGARRVSKVRRKEIGFPSCGPDFGNRLLAALHIATYDHDVDAKLR